MTLLILWQYDIIIPKAGGGDSMAVSKVTTTVRLDESVYEQLQKIAAEEVRSVNNLIEYALTKFIREYQQAD